MQSAVKETFMVRRLQERAKQQAKGGATGTASCGDITVAWYPGCQRFAWFSKESGAITKKLAVKLLEDQGK
jgi:hypothetical protein